MPKAAFHCVHVEGAPQKWIWAQIADLGTKTDLRSVVLVRVKPPQHAVPGVELGLAEHTHRGGPWREVLGHRGDEPRSLGAKKG